MTEECYHFRKEIMGKCMIRYTILHGCMPYLSQHFMQAYMQGEAGKSVEGVPWENNRVDPFVHTSQAKGQVRLQLFFVPNMNRTEPDAKEASTPVVDLAGGTGIKEILSSGKGSSLERL